MVRLELEFRHGRMAGYDPFCQSLAKRFDRIAQMQGPERRRDPLICIKRLAADPLKCR